MFQKFWGTYRKDHTHKQTQQLLSIDFNSFLLKLLIANLKKKKKIQLENYQ